MTLREDIARAILDKCTSNQPTGKEPLADVIDWPITTNADDLADAVLEVLRERLEPIRAKFVHECGPHTYRGTQHSESLNQGREICASNIGIPLRPFLEDLFSQSQSVTHAESEEK